MQFNTNDGKDHIPYVCQGDCEGCQFCDGGLQLCTVCGGAEGSLTADCPGYTISSEVLEHLVYGGFWDFTTEKGWVIHKWYKTKPTYGVHMTIVAYFHPWNIQHVRAWKKLAEVIHASTRYPGVKSQALTDDECKNTFATALKLITTSVDWPEDWAFQIGAKMADQWIADLEYRTLQDDTRRWQIASLGKLLSNASRGGTTPLGLPDRRV